MAILIGLALAFSTGDAQSPLVVLSYASSFRMTRGSIEIPTDGLTHVHAPTTSRGPCTPKIVAKALDHRLAEFPPHHQLS